jgi:hypothetical protein
VFEMSVFASVSSVFEVSVFATKNRWKN